MATDEVALATAMAGVSLVKEDEWTQEEMDACLAVRDVLIKEKGLSPKQVGEVELITITLNAKCRKEEAVSKFMTYHEQLLKEYGISDVWADTADLHDQLVRGGVQLAAATHHQRPDPTHLLHGGGHGGRRRGCTPMKSPVSSAAA